MNIKKKIIIVTFSLLLLLTIIFEVVLLCTDVFPGTYKSSSKENNYEITFYDNTFEWKIFARKDYSTQSGLFTTHYEAGQLLSNAYGFFTYDIYEEDTERNLIVLHSESSGQYPSLASTYRRNSVFSITCTNEGGATFTCGVAIFLQVLLCFFAAGSIIAIIWVIRKGR